MELPLLIPVEKVLDDRGYFHKILDQGILSDNGIKDFQAFEMFSTLSRLLTGVLCLVNADNF